MDGNMYRKISKEKWSQWMAASRQEAEILVPAKAGGLWVYAEYQGGEIPPGFRNSRRPPKEFFFEPWAPLFGWKWGEGPVLEPIPAPQRRRMIFGLRPCDARALKTIEPVFGGEYRDDFFLGNLSRTLLLGLACRFQCEGSFCGEMGVDSQDAQECDLFFRETPAGFVVQSKTPGGEALFAKEFFEEASPGEWDAARWGLRGKREKPLFDLEKAKAGVAERFADQAMWERLSAKCINCATCTYLCPTCYCFDLQDQQVPAEGFRFRCQDSCAFSIFTRMAVHNPREEKWRRYRQRVSHKFNYFLQNFQAAACVGCGRCVAHCPVNLDLREVLGEVAR